MFRTLVVKYLDIGMQIFLHNNEILGSADAVACLPVPRALVFSSRFLFAWWSPLLFILRFFIIETECRGHLRKIWM
jgi:hypothetical protein